MTVLTPAHADAELAETEELFLSVRRALADLRVELESLKQRAQAGEEINGTAASKTIASVGDAVGRCQKAELLLNDCRNKQAGIARGGHALDLDRARADIGCKLDRLRCTADPGGVP
ncbi:hypothetical protein [Sulfitobacter sp. S190]|uniref:hypothetical protein n=1 Tax=Sulfitobacter sp. S190 TaxID=2867022 RepID=UPI0021A77FD6|nr:hypothetical protein [Sulfitobacter sp. S190]